MAQNREIGELGQYLTVNTSSNTIQFNATINVSSIAANGSVGTNGQVLLSNGTSSYWANAVLKVYNEANTQVFP